MIRVQLPFFADHGSNVSRRIVFAPTDEVSAGRLPKASLKAPLRSDVAAAMTRHHAPAPRPG